ncbi:hypothetical protein H2199_006936 [Coniosporium tulheliwenetii]|uniref:Uncharacterized protein n=1 Tax=Coniosporium tulheliwenetii TaxID=3383036 RepID=A0ACC2YS84_9PEZI|nr:hypothetical protein H2199_006936 [Cladosporium sp. JES 115]
MSCQFASDYILAPGVKFGQFAASFAEHIICPETCLRPDPGGALIPWLYALFLLLFHLPACIIRAVRWESAQYLALGLAIVGITLCVQAYLSTGLKADEVLVWMPLALILDVGAMLQMVVLPRKRAWRSSSEHCAEGGLDKTLAGDGRSHAWQAKGGTSTGYGDAGQNPPNDAEAGQNSLNDEEAGPNPPNNANVVSNPEDDGRLRYAVVAVVAFALLLILVILQLWGLAAAVKGRNEKDIAVKTVKWCSPSFRDFALAVTNGNCKKYEITESRSNGAIATALGCIHLPARQQRDWLTGTIVGLVGALVFQIVDMTLLRCTHGIKLRGVKMQRPWLTMFGGYSY